MDPVTLLLSVIAIIEGFVGVLQLVQMVGTRVAVIRVQRFIGQLENDFKDPDKFKETIKLIGNGIGGGLLERLGAAKGGAVRAGQAMLQEGALESVDMDAMGGLLQIVPRKYQKQLQLLLAGYQMLKGNQGGGLPFLQQQGQGSSGQPQ